MSKPSPTVFKIKFHEVETRAVIDRDGCIWFAAPDICCALSLKPNKGGYSHHVRKLDDDEKALVDRGVFDGTPMPDIGVLEKGFELINATPVNVNRSIWAINEYGAYQLALRSDKAEAKLFKRWITHEVLPEIRRTGCYVGEQQAPALDMEAIVQAIRTEIRAELRREMKKLPAGKEQSYKGCEGIDPLIIDMLRRVPKQELAPIYSALSCLVSGVPHTYTCTRNG